MEVSLPALILIPMVFHLVIVGVCWLYYVVRDNTLRVRLTPDRKRIYRCQVCEFVYLDARDVPLARCPRCGCLNEAVKT